MTQKITPFLWFDNQAEEAAAYYTAIFNESAIGAAANYEGEAGEKVGRPKGTVMVVDFEIAG